MSENYLDLHLPVYLEDSLKKFLEGKRRAETDENYLRFDCDYCFLQSSINCAETDNEISSAQAWYLREKYLGLSKKENSGAYA